MIVWLCVKCYLWRKSFESVTKDFHPRVQAKLGDKLMTHSIIIITRYTSIMYIMTVPIDES